MDLQLFTSRSNTFKNTNSYYEFSFNKKFKLLYLISSMALKQIIIRWNRADPNLLLKIIYLMARANAPPSHQTGLIPKIFILLSKESWL